MIELRPYQAEGLTALWNYFQEGNKGNPLIAWPTGTGKSICPAVFIKYVFNQWPSQRFLMITHVAELIKQNLKVLQYIWPNAPVGVYSAGLDKKETAFPIVYGGIQSMIKCPEAFGHRDIIFIDEAHLISLNDASMYRTFLAAMKLINPQIKIIGMTATPFRMGQGYITEGGIFTDIVHDLTSLQAFNKLVAEGYISPLIPLRTKTELDVSAVQVQNGEFVATQLQKAVDKNEITYAGIKELIEVAHNRRSWLIFASGIEHSEHIAQMLETFGVECAAIHSKQPDEYNDKAIERFKSGELKAVSNFGKLTTGFDYPPIDLIGMFRPTMSVPLWVQMLGRGTRPSEGKSNCLVLDFARNTKRLGPINDPIIPRKKGKETGEAPIKICESCGAYNHASVRICAYCGEEFKFKIKITAKPGTDELLREAPIVETFPVQYAIYAKRQSRDKTKPPYVRATYFSDMKSFTENVFPEYTGYPRKLFEDFWKQRHIGEAPKTCDEFLQYASKLRVPKKIRVHTNNQYPNIVGAEW